jgi:hypothetical protein
MLIFLWDAKNAEHIGEHNVAPGEAEYVVRNAARPYPKPMPHGKFLVWGQTEAGRYLQVVYVERDPEQVEPDELSAAAIAALMEDDAEFIYIIHAMQFSASMKHRHKRDR